MEFVRDLNEFLMRNDVHILGGNDNQEDAFAEYHEDRVDWDLDRYYVDDSPRSMKSGDWWTLYHPSSGGKVRFSFNDKAEGLVRSAGPELVDMKITDYCDAGCTFCYQDSTREGTHADYERVTRYFDYMKELGVFEVALGGGEPTLHPRFIDILKYSREVGIVPNFTTYRSPRVWGNALIDVVREYAGAFAISVSSSRS